LLLHVYYVEEMPQGQKQSGVWVGISVGGDDVYRHVQQYFSYIVEVSLIGGGIRSIRRKPQTCCNLLTNNFIT
jgi:hypothetical protein